MTGAAILDIARDGIITFLKVAAPLMIIALAVGLVVSLLQALTQIQEQTLIFVPKILAVFATMLLMLPFMGDALAGYMTPHRRAHRRRGIITCPQAGEVKRARNGYPAA
jgi:flagellar biosynthetic protein FliQ